MALAADTVAAARGKMLAAVTALAPEPVTVGASGGRTLAASVAASRAQPPFRSAAMDGYAVRASALGPGALTVVGEGAAGRPYDGRCVGPGTTVRIFTGAPVPDGADLVVPQERARRDGSRVWLDAGTQPRSNIREPGIDFPAGEVLVRAGTRLSPLHVALIAASGAACVQVTRTPRIALIATGGEILQPGAAAAAHQIFDSVSFGLAALISDWGGEALRHAIPSDDTAAIAAAAAAALPAADLLVIIGGASVGDYDVVKSALGALGLVIAVPRIAVRPGKPTWFGRAAGKPVLGLPGNPAAALVGAHLFLRPLLAALLAREPCEERVRALLEGAVGESGASECYWRARLGYGEDARLRARPFDNQDTSLVSVFAAANALICRPAGAPAAASGTLVEVLRL